MKKGENPLFSIFSVGEKLLYSRFFRRERWLRGKGIIYVRKWRLTKRNSVNTSSIKWLSFNKMSCVNHLQWIQSLGYQICKKETYLSYLIYLTGSRICLLIRHCMNNIEGCVLIYTFHMNKWYKNKYNFWSVSGVTGSHVENKKTM